MGLLKSLLEGLLEGLALYGQADRLYQQPTKGDNNDLKK